MINGVYMSDKNHVEKHSYDDFGFLIKSLVINAPTVQTHKVEIPGRNGLLDLTESLTGKVQYNNREITIEFRYLGAENTRSSVLSQFENFAHGQLMKFTFDDDYAYYYEGRIESIEPVVNGKAYDITVTIDADPMKYYLQSTAEDWLWDPFDFEEGVINEPATNLVVSGTLVYTLLVTGGSGEPTIISTAAMTVLYKGKTYSIIKGTQVMYGLVISEGENILQFNGNGKVTIEFRGGRL